MLHSRQLGDAMGVGVGRVVMGVRGCMGLYSTSAVDRASMLRSTDTLM